MELIIETFDELLTRVNSKRRRVEIGIRSLNTVNYKLMRLYTDPKISYEDIDLQDFQANFNLHQKISNTKPVTFESAKANTNDLE
jgi:hypothetical protein